MFSTLYIFFTYSFFFCSWKRIFESLFAKLFQTQAYLEAMEVRVHAAVIAGGAKKVRQVRLRAKAQERGKAKRGMTG